MLCNTQSSKRTDLGYIIIDSTAKTLAGKNRNGAIKIMDHAEEE